MTKKKDIGLANWAKELKTPKRPTWWDKCSPELQKELSDVKQQYLAGDITVTKTYLASKLIEKLPGLGITQTTMERFLGGIGNYEAAGH